MNGITSQRVPGQGWPGRGSMGSCRRARDGCARLREAPRVARKTNDPKDFGRVAVLAGGWVSGRACEVPVALRADANARPGMAGPGVNGELPSRQGWLRQAAGGAARG